MLHPALEALGDKIIKIDEVTNERVVLTIRLLYVSEVIFCQQHKCAILMKLKIWQQIKWKIKYFTNEYSFIDYTIMNKS